MRSPDENIDPLGGEREVLARMAIKNTCPPIADFPESFNRYLLFSAVSRGAAGPARGASYGRRPPSGRISI